MSTHGHLINRVPLAGRPHPIEVRVPLRIVSLFPENRQPHPPAAGDRATAGTSLSPFGAFPPSRTHTRIVVPSPEERRERKRLGAVDRLSRGHGRRS